ncbi:hypothetical protein ACT1UH_02915 [Mycoplasma sp. 332]|uniref:hypothetical protein n=1 Tax=Mycoplasma sp. 332 TaxID=3458236 RepID=UPI004035B7BE
MKNLPTYKDLKINIKDILWKNNFKNFEEFQKAYSAIFCAKLGFFLNSVGKHNKDFFSLCYNIIFYYGFINYKREKELMDILSKNDFNVWPTYMIMDAVIGVDLIASKNNKTYVIQVKPNNIFENAKFIQKFADKRNYLVVFAYKRKEKWFFLNKFKQKIKLI